MAFNKCLLVLFAITLINLYDCSPIETNCTKVESIDGSVGVECHRTKKSSDKFEPTVIDQHFVELFSRSKRAAEDSPKPEELVSELFIQNLAVMANANMSDCMDRVNCEEKCQLIADGTLKATENDTKEIEAIKELPSFVRSFYEAGKRGIELGSKGHNVCDQCRHFFRNCNSMQYDYTIKTNALYKELLEKNITLFDDSDQTGIPQDIAYLHHSMTFLDVANLSRCYARVSCELTCKTVKADPNAEAPPMKSPLLANDPKKPKSVDIIHEGALLGFTLGFNGVCDTCSMQYADCPAERYAIAHTSSIIFG